MKNKKNKNLTSWDDHIDEKYGKTGIPTRDKYEQGFEAFKLGVLIQEARKKRHLTQEELALKVGTTKSYISRIENDASDIRLSTLMRIISDGLGGHLKLILETENPEILELAKNLFTKGRKADFWNTLSIEQKQEIEAGIIEISNGETVDYESVMRKHRK